MSLIADPRNVVKVCRQDARVVEKEAQCSHPTVMLEKELEPIARKPYLIVMFVLDI